MQPADWDRVFVADLAAEHARLGKAYVMRFGMASDRRQCTAERRRTCSAHCRAGEWFLPQRDGGVSRARGRDDRSRSCLLHQVMERLLGRRSGSFRGRRLQFFPTIGSRNLDRCELSACSWRQGSCGQSAASSTHSTRSCRRRAPLRFAAGEARRHRALASLRDTTLSLCVPLTGGAPSHAQDPGRLGNCSLMNQVRRIDVKIYIQTCSSIMTTKAIYIGLGVDNLAPAERR
jgi:hypothetical protein